MPDLTVRIDIDPRGLSEASFPRPRKVVPNGEDRAAIDSKTTLNNILSGLRRLNPKRKKPPLKGWGEQADKVASDLQFPIKRYDDNWTFSVVTIKSGHIPIFFHQIAVAHSSNRRSRKTGCKTTP